jgi:hypothetical protein
MFKSIKNALGLKSGSPDKAVATPIDSRRPSEAMPLSAQSGYSKVSEWASMQGLTASERKDGRGYQVDGKVAGRPWRMEQGKPSRDFIHGQELRARAEMGINDDVSVLIMTRQLKTDLEKRAFSIYTDTLQTTVDPNLPEEMRWLAMYEEYAWESVGEAFFNDYAVLADDYQNALSWINRDLVQQLLAWPVMDPSIPKVIMLLRGKVYLRMQIEDADMPTIEHATRVFTSACELAVSSFRGSRGD